MQEALIFLFRSLLELYILTFVLRLILQAVRADFRNPISQFVLKVTDPLVVPLRRILPSVGMLDTATLLVALILQGLLMAILLNLACINGPGLLQLAGLSIARLVELLLNIYFWLILAHVVASWISPGQYNPMLHLLSQIVEPVLLPFRKLIPPIAGLDLSPILLILATQFLIRLIPTRQLLGDLVCGAVI